MRTLMTWLTASLPLLAAAPGLHELDVQGLFEAGKYQEVVQATEGQGTPANLYLAGQSYQKLNQPDNAKMVFQKLASRGATDPWHHIGQSTIYLLEGNLDGALAAAQQAVELGPTLPEARYQLGLAHGHKKDFTPAAAEFDEAGRLRAAFAYAHYHAGLSYYQIKRIDRMATHFEAFLKLAPNAPERGQVESIMQTVRGR